MSAPDGEDVLIKRLRVHAGAVYTPTDELLIEAADTIKRLTARVKELEDAIEMVDKDMRQDIERLADENARLREALLPFGRLLHPHHEAMPDERPIFGIHDTTITVGDLRRAALERKP